MDKANISILNKKNIKSGKLAKLMPEFYELKNVIENDLYHNKESVFNHTFSVLDNLEKIIQNFNKEAKKALSKIVEKNSRKNLLKIVALLHDIAKKETIVNLDGITSCPGHQEKGAKKAERILRRFNLSKEELKIITSIVRGHDLINEIVIQNKSNFQKEYEAFKKKFSKLYLELLLLDFASIVSCYSKKIKKTEFNQWINFYKKELKNFSI